MPARAPRRVDYLHDAIEDLRRIVDRKNLRHATTGARAYVIEATEVAFAVLERDELEAEGLFREALGVAHYTGLVTDDEYDRIKGSVQ